MSSSSKQLQTIAPTTFLPITFDYLVQGARLTTRFQTNWAYFFPTPIPCILFPIMNKMLFYALNYCNTSNQCSTSQIMPAIQSTRPNNGISPLRGGQTIFANGIYPTRNQFPTDGIFLLGELYLYTPLRKFPHSEVLKQTCPLALSRLSYGS